MQGAKEVDSFDRFTDFYMYFAYANGSAPAQDGKILPVKDVIMTIYEPKNKPNNRIMNYNVRDVYEFREFYVASKTNLAQAVDNADFVVSLGTEAALLTNLPYTNLHQVFTTYRKRDVTRIV